MQINPKLIKRKVATAYLSNSVSNLGHNKIPFNTINSNDSQLTLSNGGIKIGKNINQVLVSGNVFLVRNNTAYLWTSIYKNATNNELSVSLSNADSGFASTSHAPKIVDVTDGDIIYMQKLDDDTGTLRSIGNTYLTVEVIG